MKDESILISQHEHGKGRVRLVKVTRTPERHYIQQIEAQILVEGEPALASYYTGDNSGVLPTDTIKNTVYVMAKKHDFDSIEEFAVILAKYFVERHPTLMQKATVKLTEENWNRVNTADTKGNIQPHHHAFVCGGTETRHTVVEAVARSNQPTQVSISSGLSGLKVCKTTQSSFMNFVKDEYTTLPEVPDRVVETIMKTQWKYNPERCKGFKDFKQLAQCIRDTLVESFAGPSDTGSPSAAVQHTLFQMGQTVLNRCPIVDSIRIYMPNVHNLPVDQTKFGLKNIHPHGEIFMPVDEPHGIIEATVSRQITSKL